MSGETEIGRKEEIINACEELYKTTSFNEISIKLISEKTTFSRTSIDKFLEENDMSNKKIYVFVTSGSSSIESTYKSLKSNFSNLNFVDGKRFTGRESDEEYKNWIVKI